MNVQYIHGVPVSNPIQPGFSLPPSPPIRGAPVRLGSIGQGSVADSLFGGSRILAGGMYALGSVASVAGTMIVPPGIPYVSKGGKLALLGTGVYLAIRAAGIFLSPGDEDYRKRAARALAGSNLTNVDPRRLPVNAQITFPTPHLDFRWKLSFPSLQAVPVEAIVGFTHNESGPFFNEPVTFAARAKLVSVSSGGKRFETYSGPHAVRVEPVGVSVAKTFQVDQPAFRDLFPTAQANLDIEIDTTKDFRHPWRVASVPIRLTFSTGR